ncbi:hypothetical protein DUNSADRAFT_12524, partial [Dunaliella salina]
SGPVHQPAHAASPASALSKEPQLGPQPQALQHVFDGVPCRPSPRAFTPSPPATARSSTRLTSGAPSLAAAPDAPSFKIRSAWHQFCGSIAMHAPQLVLPPLPTSDTRSSSPPLNPPATPLYSIPLSAQWSPLLQHHQCERQPPAPPQCSVPLDSQRHPCEEYPPAAPRQSVPLASQQRLCEQHPPAAPQRSAHSALQSYPCEQHPPAALLHSIPCAVERHPLQQHAPDAPLHSIPGTLQNQGPCEESLHAAHHPGSVSPGSAERAGNVLEGSGHAPCLSAPSDTPLSFSDTQRLLLGWITNQGGRPGQLPCAPHLAQRLRQCRIDTLACGGAGPCVQGPPNTEGIQGCAQATAHGLSALGVPLSEGSFASAGKALRTEVHVQLEGVLAGGGVSTCTRASRKQVRPHCCRQPAQLQCCVLPGQEERLHTLQQQWQHHQNEQQQYQHQHQHQQQQQQGKQQQEEKQHQQGKQQQEEGQRQGKEQQQGVEQQQEKKQQQEEVEQQSEEEQLQEEQQ